MTDLHIVEGDLEVLRDRTRIVGEDLEPVTVADIGGYVTSAGYRRKRGALDGVSWV